MYNLLCKHIIVIGTLSEEPLSKSMEDIFAEYYGKYKIFDSRLIKNKLLPKLL